MHRALKSGWLVVHFLGGGVLLASLKWRLHRGVLLASVQLLECKP